MALVKPQLYNMSAFDATQAKTFNFNVIGGDQVVKNKLVIIRQSDSAVIYQQTQTTFVYKHDLPANTLTNGVYYEAYVITYNANNNASPESNHIQFYCFSSPSFSFSNIPMGNVVTNATYSFAVTYNQSESEMLNSYTFNLYTAQQSLLASSGMLYVGGTASLPLSVEYTFTGLNDATSYYIEATGQTIHGMIVDTGKILISIQYEIPNVFSVLSLSNNCTGGYITIQSNLVDIDGSSVPSPPIYVDNNTAVNVTGTGNYVLWDHGYNVTGNFTASLWGRSFNANSTIIEMSDGLQTLTVRYYKDANNFCYAELIVQEGFITYYIYSNTVYIYPNDEVQIWFRRIDSLYEIGLYDLTDTPDFVLGSSTNGLIGVNSLS